MSLASEVTYNIYNRIKDTVSIGSKWTCGIVMALSFAMIIFNFGCAQESTPTPLQFEQQVQAQEATPTEFQPAQPVQMRDNSPDAWQRFSQALTEDKYIYLFFYELGNANCEIMERNLDSFAQKTEKNVEIIKVDRMDSTNDEIVETADAQIAPIPLTLLYEPNGVIVAAFTDVASEEQLEEVFPSPKKAETLKNIQQGKGVILSFTNNEMLSREAIHSSCLQAKDKLAGIAEYISIDLLDPEEMGFIRELGIDPATPVPVTLVINSQSQVAAKYEGEVQVDNLVEAVTTVVPSGCCSVGSGKTCTAN